MVHIAAISGSRRGPRTATDTGASGMDVFTRSLAARPGPELPSADRGDGEEAARAAGVQAGPAGLRCSAGQVSIRTVRRLHVALRGYRSCSILVPSSPAFGCLWRVSSTTRLTRMLPIHTTGRSARSAAWFSPTRRSSRSARSVPTVSSSTARAKSSTAPRGRTGNSIRCRRRSSGRSSSSRGEEGLQEWGL